MDLNSVLAAIESELARLLHIKSVLAGTPPAKRRGRKPGSTNKTTARAAAKKSAGKSAKKSTKKSAKKSAKKSTKKSAKKSATKSASAGTPAKKTRTLTPEGRKRIQEAVKRRWANKKK